MKTIALREVTVRFHRVVALDNVTVKACAGRALMLAGPNGAGKTTLMRVLLGLIRPQKGQLAVDGEARSVDNRFKRELGYLPEAVAFAGSLSGRQVLRFFARARGVSRKRVEVVLERVGLKDAGRRRVRGYSRGMRQRLGLGVAILAEPQLLILDEPTGGLDQEGLSVLWSVLEEWRDKGRTVLLSSHDLALLERRIDDLCVFKAGKVVAAGTPEHLREQTNLRHRVKLELDTTHGDRVAELITDLQTWGRGDVVPNGKTVMVAVQRKDLLGLMDIRGHHTESVVGLRIEEPTLDVVYEHLLGAS